MQSACIGHSEAGTDYFALNNELCFITKSQRKWGSFSWQPATCRTKGQILKMTVKQEHISHDWVYCLEQLGSFQVLGDVAISWNNCNKPLVCPWNTCLSKTLPSLTWVWLRGCKGLQMLPFQHWTWENDIWTFENRITQAGWNHIYYHCCLESSQSTLICKTVAVKR